MAGLLKWSWSLSAVGPEVDAKLRPAANEVPRRLIPLDDYVPPSLPTDEFVKVWTGRLQAMLGRSQGASFIADERLRRVALRRLDQVVAPPATGTVQDEVAASVRAWLEGPPTSERLKAIVLPPCDATSVMEAWAHGEGHAILDRDCRADDPETALAMLDVVSPEQVVVVPRLERWALRCRSGLAPVRALLAKLDARQQRAVLGCNAFGWAFLSQAVGVGMLVGAPLTPQPFDGPRLRDWFGGLAGSDAARNLRFRLSDGGTDLLELVGSSADEAARKASDRFFAALAGRSRGVPWVAWHMWRRMLHTDREQDDDATSLREQETLWVAGLDELVLPGCHPREALLVLHAILIHDTLALSDLQRVLPVVEGSLVPAALVSAGFLEREGDVLRVRAEAYPAVRAGLVTGGLPVGKG